MGHRYQHIAFGAAAVERQRRTGSVTAYGAGLGTADEGPQALTSRELALIGRAFQFHLATVTPAGWPYVQYRSGPCGFLQHRGGNRLGFADFRGNQQFVSVGNLEHDDRVALFLADYPRKLRLKLFGRARVLDAADDPATLDRLCLVDGRRIASRCERSVLIDVEAFDWNCSRSLIPQYTAEQVGERIEPYREEIRELRARVAELEERRQPADPG